MVHKENNNNLAEMKIETILNLMKRIKQAGAELCQAQGKLNLLCP